MAARKTTQKKSKESGTGTQDRRRRSQPRRTSPLRLLLDLLLMSWIGRVLLVMLLIAVVLGLNLLISANQYDLFFILAGIELVAVALFFWLRLVLRRN